MNTQHLEALLIDQSLGELSDDVSALLDAYLEQHPELRENADRTRDALCMIEKVAASRPELFEAGMVSEDQPVPFRSWIPRLFSAPLMKAAAVLIALVVATGAGYIGGHQKNISQTTGAPTAPGAPIAGKAETAVPVPSPWARYRFEDNGNLTVVATFDPKA